MTDTSAPTPPGGAPQPQPGAAPAPPSLRVLNQYVRDLSFENPGNRAPESQPNIDLGIDVSAAAHESGNSVFEVALKLSAKATAGDSPLFVTELDYGGLFQLENVPEAQVEPMLLIECPRLLFPFARRIVAEITREGGFPPLMIDPVDFVGIYQQQKAQGVQAPVAPPQAPPPTA